MKEMSAAEFQAFCRSVAQEALTSQGLFNVSITYSEIEQAVAVERIHQTLMNASGQGTIRSIVDDRETKEALKVSETVA